MLRLTVRLILWLQLIQVSWVSVYGCEPFGPRPRRGLETVKQWRRLEFGFANAQDRLKAEAAGNLQPEVSTPVDVDVHYKVNGQRRIFVTIPRFGKGVPYTLALVTDQQTRNGPVLMPYPNFAWHNNNNNCDSITSVYNVAISECNELWVMDSGIIDGQQICPPQLLKFDLSNDRLLHRFRLPNNTYIPHASLLIAPNLLVQDPPPCGKCKHTMIYIPDCRFHGLVMYDHQINAAWRAEHRFMYPDPDYGRYTIAGESFTLMNGIFAASNDKRNLYFHPKASVSEYAVPLSVLNRRENWANSVDAMEDQFKLLGKRNSQCAASAMDSHNNLYCVNFNPIQLFAWNTKTPYTKRYFINLPGNASELEFVSGIKVVRNPMGQEELWLCSIRFQ
ncbi:yellow-d, partial [Drosophila busckii]